VPPASYLLAVRGPNVGAAVRGLGAQSKGFSMNQPLQEQGKGFLRALFDFSFTTYITPKIIKVIFGIVIVVSGLGWLGYTIFAFATNVVLGIIVFVIIGPLIFLLYIILARVYLEVVMAVFTIAENSTRIAQSLGGGTAGPTPFQGAPQPGYQGGPPAGYQPSPAWAPTQTADPSGAWTPPPSAAPTPPPWSPSPPADPSGTPPAWPGTPAPPSSPPPSQPPPA
jgi:hypothetical protein